MWIGSCGTGTHQTSRDPLICCADLHKSLKISNSFNPDITVYIKNHNEFFGSNVQHFFLKYTSDHSETKKFQLKSCFLKLKSNIERANVENKILVGL